jgi:hypothetical protein
MSRKTPLPRIKFIDPGEWAVQRKPHVRSYPTGLWWYRSLSLEESACVRQVYLQQRGSRDVKISPRDFPEKLELWLSDLTTNQVAVGRPQFWTLKGYALAHKINPQTFMAWFRKLEAVAKRLYPDRVPPGRHNKPPLSDDKIRIIRNEYLATGKILEIAKRHHIDPWRVGQICRAEKQSRRAALNSNKGGVTQAEAQSISDDSDSELPSN